MSDYYSLSQEDSNAAREYREYVESTHVTPEWYLIERAFKDGICFYYGLPLSGEIPSSIVGNIAMAMYKGSIKYLNYA